MIGIIISALASTLTTAVTTQAFILGTAFRHFLFTAALGYALNALTPRPDQSGGRGYSVNQIGSDLRRVVIYGQARVGGVVFYQETTSAGTYLHRCIAIATHEVEEFTTIYVDNEEVTLDGSGFVTSPSKWANLIRIKTHNGTSDQEADDDLTIESESGWSDQHRARGVAYIYVRVQYDTDAFPNGIPDITALVKGKLLYDPRDESTAWSANAALCLRDYLTSDYGLNANITEIDDARVITAANVCDETVDLAAGGTESRYECNGSFVVGKPKDIIPNLLTAMGGTIWYAQGKWRIKAASYTAPTVTFSEDDLRSNIRISTRTSRRDLFNRVRGTFSGPETDWQVTDYPAITSGTFLTVDGGLESTADIDLPFTSTSTACQRIGKIALYRAREQIVVNSSFGIRALQVQIGDIVMFTNARAGWLSKEFEVVDWRLSLTAEMDLQVQLTLREISSAVFDWDAEEASFETDNTTLPDSRYVPAVGITTSTDVRIINEHITNVLVIDVSSSEPSRIDYIEVQAKASTASEWTVIGTGDLGLFDYIDLDELVTYNVRARAVNSLGVRGDWYPSSSGTTSTVTPDTVSPDDVAGFIGEVNGDSISLAWDPVTDFDLSYYRIRYASETAGATWANATTLVDKVPRPATSIVVPARAGTYMIRAYDKRGNSSDGYTSITVGTSDIYALGTTDTQTEDPAFSGTKTGCSVTSSELRITDPSSAPSEATYEFSTYIDTASVRRARARIDISTERHDTSSGLWDDMPGNWDEWQGLWDDWTGDVQFADTNVVAYVSTTDDDPSGSPTWSDWRIIRSAYVSGRAFKFKVVLSSTGDGVTPSITALAAKVEY